LLLRSIARTTEIVRGQQNHGKPHISMNQIRTWFSDVGIEAGRTGRSGEVYECVHIMQMKPQALCFCDPVAAKAIPESEIMAVKST
jgi:hypothetical protein